MHGASCRSKKLRARPLNGEMFKANFHELTLLIQRDFFSFTILLKENHYVHKILLSDWQLMGYNDALALLL